MDLVAGVIGILAFIVMCVQALMDADLRDMKILISSAIITFLCVLVIAAAQLATPTVTVNEYVSDYAKIRDEHVRFSQPVRIRVERTEVPWLVSHTNTKYFVIIEK